MKIQFRNTASKLRQNLLCNSKILPSSYTILGYIFNVAILATDHQNTKRVKVVCCGLLVNMQFLMKSWCYGVRWTNNLRFHIVNGCSMQPGCKTCRNYHHDWWFMNYSIHNQTTHRQILVIIDDCTGYSSLSVIDRDTQNKRILGNPFPFIGKCMF